jgi:hypothetical protein
MFVKIHLQLDTYKIFRIDDIISIDPVIGSEGIAVGYKVRLKNDQEDLDIAIEQAHDLSLQLRHVTIYHPRQYQ